jgi:quercetin dioxygenase-like cupin family protein
MAGLAAGICLGFAVAAVAADKHPEGVAAARLLDIKWKDGPLPGSKSALLAGDPKTGMHHAYLKLADGAFVPPHWHTADEYVTIVQGTILFGTGDNADRDKTRLYAAGAFVHVPAGVRHFAWAKGEVVLSQTRGGPIDFNWVHPEDAPKEAPAATPPAENK